MTVDELAAECQRRIDARLKWIALVVDEPSYTRHGLVRLVPRSRGKSPHGELACINSKSEIVAHFKVLDIVAYLAAKDMIGVRGRIADISANPAVPSVPASQK